MGVTIRFQSPTLARLTRTLRTVRDHYDALVADEMYYRWTAAQNNYPYGTEVRSYEELDLVERVDVCCEAFGELVIRYWLTSLCRWRGHDYEPNGHDYPDSGGEGFSCRRCGVGFTAWH